MKSKKRESDILCSPANSLYFVLHGQQTGLTFVRDTIFFSHPFQYFLPLSACKNNE